MSRLERNQEAKKEPENPPQKRLPPSPALISSLDASLPLHKQLKQRFAGGRKMLKSTRAGTDSSTDRLIRMDRTHLESAMSRTNEKETNCGSLAVPPISRSPRRSATTSVTRSARSRSPDSPTAKSPSRSKRMFAAEMSSSFSRPPHRQREPDGTLDDDRRVSSRERPTNHRRRPLLRLRSAGPQG